MSPGDPMKKLMIAAAAALLLPAAHAQEGNKGMGKMEKMDMEKKHGAMHDKMQEKMKGKHGGKKAEPAKKDEAAKKDEHKH
jgi:hypothetical protein